MNRLRLEACRALLLIVALYVQIAVAQPAAVDLDLPAQPLETSLRQLADSQKLQIIYVRSDLKDIQAPPLRGRFTIVEALSRLTEGTRLQASFNGSDTIFIRPRGDDKKPQARATDSSTVQLEGILVTAQKRTELYQDVPISMSVLQGLELDRSRVEGVTEALSRVPGVGINVTYQGGGTQLAVRGVAAGGALFNGSSPVAYYLDSIPFGMVRQAIVPDPNAYDLQQVEVLRGPQGTLYGASALNGVVRVLTKDADTERFDFKARALASSTARGGDNYRADMALNVPIVPGKVAARAVIGYENLSGWINRPNKEDINDAELRNLRLKINAHPTESLSIGLTTWFSRASLTAASISDDKGNHFALQDEPIYTDFDAYGLKVGYEFPGASFTSMTSYLKYSNDGFPDLAVLGLTYANAQTSLASRVLSEEVLLTSTAGGPWRWSIGGIYRDAEDRQFQNNRFQAAPLDQTYISKSYAVFGEVTRTFLDGRFEVTGGLRYFNDEVTGREDSRLNGAPPSQLVTSKDTFDEVSPRIVAAWHPNREVTAYASYSEGFRSGFGQTGNLLALAPQFGPLEADTLRNYEVGAKATILNGRAFVDAALYYIDWQNLQQSLTVPIPGSAGFAVALINGTSASGVGFDLGLTARPTAGLSLGLNFSWNNLRMDTDVISGGVVLFDKGDRLNISPKYTVGASADYDFPLGSGGYTGRLSASANYTSPMDLRTIVGTTRRIAFGDAILITRASFSISGGRWSATVFGDNLNDEKGSPVRFPFVASITDWDSRVRPRTFGAQVEYRF